MVKHKCADCGFLASRNSQSRELEELESGFRERGQPAIIFNKEALFGMGARHESEPLCFAQGCDLRKEFMVLTLKNHPTYELSDRESILEIIQQDRECDSFTKWQQGFTPKEHREMMDRERFQKWQVDREEADKRYRDKREWKLVIYAGSFTMLGAVIGAVIALVGK